MVFCILYYYVSYQHITFFCVEFQISWETLYSRPPPLQALKSFGCACYPYLRPYNKNKLQPRSQECTFLGYPPLSKCYICLDPSSNKIYISCFGSFNESLFPFAHNFAYTDPYIPFTSDFSHWFSSSSHLISDIIDVPSLSSSDCSPSSFPFDLTTSLLPYILMYPLLLLPLHLRFLALLLFLLLTLLLLLLLFLILPFLSLTTIILWLQDQNMVYISLKLCRFIMTTLWQNHHLLLLLLIIPSALLLWILNFNHFRSKRLGL